MNGYKTAFNRLSAGSGLPAVLLALLMGCGGPPVEPRYLSQETSSSPKTVKLGFFFGGRTFALYRAYVFDYFSKDGLDVALYTRYLGDKDWHLVPRKHEEVVQLDSLRRDSRTGFSRKWGKVSGIEIIKAIDGGLLQGGTPGLSSFVQCVAEGTETVAVAALGVEDEKWHLKAIVVRKGLVIKSPEDFKGKRFITRRAGPGDAVALREFLESIGLDPRKDVTITDQVSDDVQRNLLRDKKADAALLHMQGIPRTEKEGIGTIYRSSDWMDPGLNQALLVFHKDFIKAHPDKVKEVLRSYMKRLRYETSLPENVRFQKGDLGIQIGRHYKNMGLPEAQYPPLVRVDLMEETQRLLLKWGYIHNKADLKQHVNNEFVQAILEESAR